MQILENRMYTLFYARIQQSRVLRDIIEEYIQNFPFNEKVYKTFVTKFFVNLEGLQAVNFINKDGVIVYVYPEEENRMVVGGNLHFHKSASEYFLEAEKNKKDVISGVVELWQGGKGIATYLPIKKNGEIFGYINCVFKLKKLFDAVFHTEILSNFYIKIEDGLRKNIIFQNFNNISNEVLQYKLTKQIFDHINLNLTVYPSHAFLQTIKHIKYTDFFIILSVLLLSVIIYLFALYNIKIREKFYHHLSQSEELYKSLVENSLLPIYIIQDNIFKYVNKTFEKMFGYTNFELIQKRIGPIELTHPDDRKVVKEKVKKRIDGEIESAQYSFRAIKKNGEVFPIEVYGARTIYNGKPAILGSIIDITDRVQKQQILKKNNEQLTFINKLVYLYLLKKDLKEIANFFIEKVLELFPFDAVVYRINNELHEKNKRKKKILEEIPEVQKAFFENIENRKESCDFPVNIDELEKACNHVSLIKKTFNATQIFPLFINFENTFVFIAEFYVFDRKGEFPENDRVFFATIKEFLELICKNFFLEEKLREEKQNLEIRVQQRTSELIKRNKELEEMKKELEGFVYTASHDIRSPIRNIKNFIDIILSDYKDTINEEVMFYLERIQSNLKAMDRTVKDLLEYATTGAKIVITEINPNEIVNEIIEELVPDREKHNIEFKINLPDRIKGDKILLRQIFENLIDNALKYTFTKEKKIIEIGYSKQKDKYVFYVKDNGIGIKKDYYDKIFDMFFRLHSKDSVEGTGIGLAIVKKAVLKLGGKIWVDSKEGEYTTFYFSLPYF